MRMLQSMLLKLINYVQTSPFFVQRSDAKSIRKQVEQQLRKAVTPCCKQLEKNLQQLHVYRQAWHGGTFVGNHVHKLLEVSTKAEFKLSCHQNTIFVTISLREMSG